MIIGIGLGYVEFVGVRVNVLIFRDILIFIFMKCLMTIDYKIVYVSTELRS